MESCAIARNIARWFGRLYFSLTLQVLVDELLRAIEPARRFGTVAAVAAGQRVAEFAQQFLLALGEAHRRLNRDRAHQVAGAAAAHGAQAHAAQAERLAAL